MKHWLWRRRASISWYRVAGLSENRSCRTPCCQLPPLGSLYPMFYRLSLTRCYRMKCWGSVNSQAGLKQCFCGVSIPNWSMCNVWGVHVPGLTHSNAGGVFQSETRWWLSHGVCQLNTMHVHTNSCWICSRCWVCSRWWRGNWFWQECCKATVQELKASVGGPADTCSCPLVGPSTVLFLSIGRRSSLCRRPPEGPSLCQYLPRTWLWPSCRPPPPSRLSLDIW